MELLVSPAVREKLEVKHGVTVAEVEECFINSTKRFLLDARARHRTNPPTFWFIAPTNGGRLLKVVFIRGRHGVILKSAFEPDDLEKRIYAQYRAG